jgi:hypothetical protein
MDVERERPAGWLHVEPRQDNRRSGTVGGLHLEAAPPEHRGEQRGIALHVGFVPRNVRDRQELEELVHDLPFVRLAPLRHGLLGGDRRAQDSREHEGAEYSADP